jgi:hypothetical protein
MSDTRLNTPFLFVVLLSLAVPIVLVPVPALLDYPNHLARIWLLGGGIEQPPFPGIYRLDWQAVTNIGIDLLAFPMARLLPAETVGQILLYLGAALPVLGAVALNRAVFGGFSWWQVGFGTVAWNLTILAGFMNFNIGLGLALLAAATDPWASRRGWPAAFLLRLALASGLLLVHVFALFFYAALLCGLAFGPGFAGLLTRSGVWGRLPPILRAAAPPVAVLAALLLLAPALPGAHEDPARAGAELTGWPRMVQDTTNLLLRKPGRKLRTTFSLIQTYWLRLDIIAMALVAAPALFALLRRELRFHAGLVLVAAALGIIFALSPHSAAGTGWIDLRFAEMAGLTLMLAIRPELPRRWAPALAGLMLAVGLARTGFVASVWKTREADVLSVERALRHLPEGVALLPLEHTARPLEAPIGRYFTDGFPAFGHLATLATPWRHAFVPTLFTAKGKQPLSVLPPWDEISVPEGPIPNAHVLTEPEGFLEGWFDYAAPYHKLWRERFDYALLLNADVPDQYGPVRIPPELELVADEGFARLYRIKR